MKTVRIFYRNRDGKDTKVLGWSEDLTESPLFHGKPMTDPANAFVAFADIEVDGTAYQSTNASGIFVHKVVDNQLVSRDPADIAKDKGNKTVIIETAAAQIEAYLQGRERPTWLMYGAEKMLQYVSALQEAAGIADNQLNAQGQAAKAALLSLRQNMVGLIDAIMTSRDAQLALLDQED